MRTVSSYITMLLHLGAVVSLLCLKDAVLTLLVVCIIVFNGCTVSRGMNAQKESALYL